MIEKRILQIIISVLVISSPLLFAQENSANKYSLMNRKELSEEIVAEVGPLRITVNEYLNNYEFGPAFIKRMKESRKRHLDFMIYEKLLALEGYSEKLDTLEDVQLFLKDIRGDLAGEKLYRALIWDKINISDQEITRALEKENTSLTLKWIFTKDSEMITRIFKELNSGVSFDSFFVNQFRDSVNYEDRYLETDRFDLENKNPALASILDSIAPGKYSRPVKTEDGWYIVKIENIWQNVISTESGYNDQRYKIESVLKKEKADSVSDVFIQEMFDQEKPVITRTAFNAVAYLLGKKYLQPSQILQWNLTENINPEYFNKTGFDFSAERIDTLVKMTSATVSIKEFFNWYSTREPYIKFILTSKVGFLNSVQGIIWRMLRDYMITRMAESQDLHNDGEVQMEMKWWKDKVVYSKMKQIIASSISMNEDKVFRYYTDHKTDYSDSSGSVKKFEEIKDDVRNDYYVHEYTRRLVNKVLTLKSKYPININADLLNKLPVTEEHNPHSIELYSIKKGGTFVRPVYPVIDNEWQFWN